MATLSETANLSQRYTNHCLRSTSIAAMDEAGIDIRHIMQITGHKNEASVRAYAGRMSTDKSKQVCASLSVASRGDKCHPQYDLASPPHARAQYPALPGPSNASAQYLALPGPSNAPAHCAQYPDWPGRSNAPAQYPALAGPSNAPVQYPDWPGHSNSSFSSGLALQMALRSIPPGLAILMPLRSIPPGLALRMPLPSILSGLAIQTPLHSMPLQVLPMPLHSFAVHVLQMPLRTMPHLVPS